MAGEEVKLAVGIEAGLALVDESSGAEAPGTEQRADTRRPGPLPHPVEALAVLHVVAELELVVGEEVSVGMDDALGESRGAGGVVELRGILGGGVDRPEAIGLGGEQGRYIDDDRAVPRVARSGRLAASVTSTVGSESSTRWAIPSSP